MGRVYLIGTVCCGKALWEKYCCRKYFFAERCFLREDIHYGSMFVVGKCLLKEDIHCSSMSAMGRCLLREIFVVGACLLLWEGFC